MTQSIRQSDLFAGESWISIYQAFTQINFNAYDFDSIRNALIDYIRVNYSENFNDWVNSSEFIAFIDLVAYLGQSLAYRIDLNSRENFIDIAERKESVLRIAQMLSYKPKRNLPSRGLLRIESISTNDDIIDSFGKNLNNINIIWNDPNNPDWFEHFILILNNALVFSNLFGQPVSKKIVNGVELSTYTLNNVPFGFGIKSFNSTVDGINLNFDVVGVYLDEFGNFEESEPSVNSSISILYRNDRNGFSSPNNGFFMYFKEGTLGFRDFRIEESLENRVIDINVENINELDVWVQSIDESGVKIKSWKKVPSVFSSNVIYNSISRNERDLFEVITRENDQISLRFGDNKFSNSPSGLLRVFYRVSSNLTYTINKDEIQNISLVYNYLNRKNQTKQLVLKLSLTENVSNATRSESIAEIRRNAPRVYYTQDRMVNGEDYNVFPLTNLSAVKIKAVNRVYSGQSRYLDIHDPTSRYQDVNVFGDDGILFYNFDVDYNEIPVNQNLSSDEIISRFVQPLLFNKDLENFIVKKLLNNTYFPVHPAPLNPSAAQYNPFPNSPVIRWKGSTNSNFLSTGYFYIDTSPLSDDSNPLDKNNPLIINNIPPQNITDLLSPGTMIKFQNNKWVTIKEVDGNGNGVFSNGKGKVLLSEYIETGQRVVKLIPPFRRKLNLQEINNIKNILDSLPQQFALYWNWFTQTWETYFITNETPSFDHQNFILLSSPTDTSIQQNRLNGWLLLFNFDSQTGKLITIRSRSLQYIFESEKEVRFYFPNYNKDLFEKIGNVTGDEIVFLTVNPDSSFTTNPPVFDSWKKNKIIGTPLNTKYNSFLVYEPFVYRDGYVEPRRIKLIYSDKDYDGYPDNPELFDELVNDNYFVFWEKYIDQYGYRYYRPKNDIRVRLNFINLNPPGLDPIMKDDIVFISSTSKFYKSLVDNATLITHFEEITEIDKYVFRKGRANIYFQWKHTAPFGERIDPAITNVIDIFVLDKEYDRNIREWIKSDLPLEKMPQAPSSFALKQTFENMENYKMISDQLIYHPVKYKLLFGKRAKEELRAKILVIKIPQTTVTDGEIKSNIISLINEYFSVQNWDFGQNFYFSELAAYIHLKMATVVASIVIVPLNEESVFGNLYQIKMEDDEMPLSVATVDDIEIVKTFNDKNLRMLFRVN
ncbi:MAG: hypothetical protein NZZ41_00275 [Candidatus Dojkabacteria bacterium]|nr:hypothetical protein [Candidatus Dojkabacteria bacterium]